MRRMNEYSMDVYQYELDHGVNPFIRYKEEDCSEEEKRELEDWLFNLMREKDIIPIPILDEHAEQEDMIRLSELDPYSVYDAENGDYGPNPIGVTFLNKFFHRELCDIRKPGSPMTIYEGFHDDKMLRRVVKKGLSYTSDISGIFRWFYMCSCGFCTNFRPATVKALLEVWGNKREGLRYFDSSAGYGARCLGSHVASNMRNGFYLGIDPNTQESCCEEIEYLDKYYPTGVEKKVLKMGSEDFTKENFPELQNSFDIYFTSPPYFNTEQYSEAETQSYKKFPKYDQWIKGFYMKTIENACSALKIDGVFGMNIFVKIPNIKEITKLAMADHGFYVIREEKYLLKTMPGLMKDENGNKVPKTRNKYDNWEPIWIGRHYSQLYKDGLITKEQAVKFRERAIDDTHRDEVVLE